MQRNLWKILFFSLLGGVVLVSVVAFVYIYRFWYLAASVNGKTFLRLQMMQELEKKYGKEYLGQQISRELIVEEASRTKTIVTDAEVDADIAAYEEKAKQQGATLENTLKERGMTQDELRDQVKIQKLVLKMIAKDVTVTNEEINNEMQKLNPPKGAKPEELRGMYDSVKESLQRKKLEERYVSWSKELQNKANIIYHVKYQ